MTARKFDITKLLAPMVLVILYGFFSLFGNNFFSTDYLINILDGSYYIGFMAIGVTFVIITGGIDLSLGTTMMCAALIGGMAYNNWHWPMGWCLALVLLVATLIGLLNGIMVAYMGLPPFIATLGTQMMGMGFGAIVTKVQTMRYPTFGTADGWFKNFFYKTTTGFPVGVEDLIEAANGNPVLVAYWFRHDLARISERLNKLQIPFSQIDTPESIRKWNTGELPVALVHPASAGHGLNLQSGGSAIIWFGLTWSLELYQQTNARLWRQGQSADTVVIQHIVAKGTIDERILSALSAKDRTQSALIAAVKAELKI